MIAGIFIWRQRIGRAGPRRVRLPEERAAGHVPVGRFDAVRVPVRVLVRDQTIGPRKALLEQRVATADRKVTNACRTSHAIDDQSMVVETADLNALLTHVDIVNARSEELCGEAFAEGELTQMPWLPGDSI